MWYPGHSSIKTRKLFIHAARNTLDFAVWRASRDAGKFFLRYRTVINIESRDGVLNRCKISGIFSSGIFEPTNSNYALLINPRAVACYKMSYSLRSIKDLVRAVHFLVRYQHSDQKKSHEKRPATSYGGQNATHKAIKFQSLSTVG